MFAPGQPLPVQSGLRSTPTVVPLVVPALRSARPARFPLRDGPWLSATICTRRCSMASDTPASAAAAAALQSLRPANAAGDIGVQCLGGVSAADLIAAAAGGMKRVALRSGLCDACADAKAGGAVDAAIEAAEGVLSELGYEIAFERSCLDLPPRVGPASEHDLGVQTGGVSRRELFSFFARGLRRTVAESAAAPKRGVAELHAQSPPPGAHDRLVNDLMALAGQASSRPVTLPVDLSLGAVTIGDACNGCGLCVRYCPHGCFRPEDSSIVVEDERCTGCGLCVEVCPPEALSAKPEKVTG